MRSLSRNNTNFPWLILPNLSISLWSSYSLSLEVGFLETTLEHNHLSLSWLYRFGIRAYFVFVAETRSLTALNKKYNTLSSTSDQHEQEIRGIHKKLYDLGVTDIDRNCVRTHWSWESMASWDCAFIFSNYHNIVGLTHSSSKDSEIGIPKVQRRNSLRLGL